MIRVAIAEDGFSGFSGGGWYCRWVSSAGVGFLLLAWGGCRCVDWFHWSWRWLLVTVLSLSVVCHWIVFSSSVVATVCHCQWSVWCTVKEVACYELSDSSVGAGGLLAFWLVGSLHPSPATEPFPPVIPCA
ncbi:hypothetical protein LOK49_LG14G01604 [Camellia lanceoleosa]|uniref:Uncharacterized protein n=1 Tax=Camellia lanceoleosa TaxID=1840588 RepID=A0ACC0FBK8_9ERIC|nr:hypothetical protein LOK49_LG14G01604 [Camellia lanceoleosa]